MWGELLPFTPLIVLDEKGCDVVQTIEKLPGGASNRYFTLANISRQTVTLINIMSLGDNWIINPLLTSICQVVIEHPQGNQSSSDGSLSTSEILLPSDE